MIVGVSTNAILAFGFDLGVEGAEELAELFMPGVDTEEDESFEFDEWIATQAGVVYPEEHSGIDSPEFEDYSTKREAAIAACPVEVITHCSYDYPMYFLALRGTKISASRGYPVAITTPTPTAEQIAAMRAFCEQHGIEWQEPSWHIFSLWG